VQTLFTTVTEIQGPTGEDGTVGERGEPGEQVTVIFCLLDTIYNVINQKRIRNFM